MKTKKTMKSIAAAALALTLIAAPAAEYAANSGLTFGIVARAEAQNHTVSTFAEFKSAFENAADGDTITLAANIDATEQLNFNKEGSSVTLNLGGYELKNTANVKGAILVSAGTLTVGGGTISALEGTDYSSQGEAKRYSMQIGGGKLVVNEGTFNGQIYAYGTSELEINDGAAVSGKNFGSWGDYAVSTNGLDSKNTKVTINGGTLTGYDAGVYIPQGDCTIAGGSITGKSAVVIRNGKVTVTGGTLTGTGTVPSNLDEPQPSYDPTYGDGTVGNGDALAIANSKGNYGTSSAEVKIEGGTFKSEHGSAVGTYIDGKTVIDTADTVKNFVEGGIFEGADGKDAFAGEVLPAGSAEVEITTAGCKKTVIGTKDIDRILKEDTTITAVEVKGGVDKITVPDNVSVKNTSSEDIVVNDVKFDGNITEPEIVNTADFKAVPEKEATCEDTGNEEYYTDGADDDIKYYTKDEDGVYTEIENLDSVTTDALGHSYAGQTAAYTWSADKTKCTASVDCVRNTDCGNSVTEEATATVSVKEATKEEKGVKTYTAAFTNPLFEAQTDTEEIEYIESDEDKVAAAKTAVEKALAELKITNDTTEADVQKAVEAAAAGTGADVKAKLTLTKATEEAAGSAKVTVDITAGDAKDSAGKEYTIPKLDVTVTEKTDKEKADEAKSAVDKALEGVTLTDKTTKADIEKAIAGVKLPEGVTAEVVVTTVPATEESEGSVKAVVTVKSGDVTNTSEISKVLPKLDKTDDPVIDNDKILSDAASAIEGGWWANASQDWIEQDNIANAYDSIKNWIKDSLPEGAEITDIKGEVKASSTGEAVFTVTVKAGDKSKDVSFTMFIKPASPVTPAATYYTIGFKGEYTGSGITVSSLVNAAGTVVTVDVPVGYTVNAKSGGNVIACISEGKGSFVMPAGNVTLEVSSYLGFLSSGYKNSYIYSYDSSMNHIRTNSVRGGMTSPEGEITVNLGKEYAGKSVTLYNGRKNTSVKVDEATLDRNGQAVFSVKSGKNYTLVVE